MSEEFECKQTQLVHYIIIKRNKTQNEARKSNQLKLDAGFYKKPSIFGWIRIYNISSFGSEKYSTQQIENEWMDQSIVQSIYWWIAKLLEVGDGYRTIYLDKSG